MFMQRSNSDTFLNESINGLQTDFGSYESNIDPFLAGLTADMYIDPVNANQAGSSDPMNLVHTPTSEIDMPLQDDDYNPYSAEDLWANIMSFDQSVNEDVQPMMIPNVMNPSNNTQNQMEFSQSCPQPIPQRPAAGMFNYPVQSSPLANQPFAAPPSSPSRPVDRKGRMTVREQGGIRALFSGPRAQQLTDKQPLRRSASANGKLGIRKKSQLSPRVVKATLPSQDPAVVTSEMQAAYRLNQELATNHDSYELSQSVPLSSSPVAMPFNDGFHAGSPTPIYNSFSGYGEHIRSERRRSTSLPPALPPSSMPALGVPEMGIMHGGNAISAPNTPQAANHSLPIQIPRTAKAHPQTVAMSEEEQQKKLDEQLLKIDFDDITVAELKEMLRERKKATNGKKADLVQRLSDERRMVEMRRSQGNRIPPAMPPANAHMSFSVPDNWYMTA
ncbi:hypothetical protein K450DRAFT_199364 [Umbelopsis ramanniana AG]|uniref:SAP domain-containing protein n=1 Tax=Umbelopsis ramanniana AG TaxID=1314678 RepID=A0AAD5EA77_UMBRA|nr:uncharacterized protein K450DRAFT_199364 [Umbelopsis ramanniana AG]KAI8579567.1 hypothetical protein K450DRAFT_199364 [Umbelopsis ramanniana AG]